MSEYQKIKNPITNRFVQTSSYLGKKIIQKYISMLGGSKDVDDSWHPSRFGSAESFHEDELEDESTEEPVERFYTAEEEPVERFYTAEEESYSESDREEEPDSEPDRD